MKVVLFCGGLGTRLREHSETIPKPLVNVGIRPIVWHLMRYYAHFGHKDFILCLGYRGDLIREYFLNYSECMSNDFVMSDGGRRVEPLTHDIADWRITFVDTGMHANLGQRLLRVRKYLEGEEMFLANYSDGLCDLRLDSYIDEFKRREVIAGAVAVRPSQSLHAIRMDDDGMVSAIESVRGIGVAVSVSTSTLVRNCLMRSLCRTPKRCSSSTTSSPRSWKRTSWPSSRCVPTTMSMVPLATPRSISAIAPRRRIVSRSTRERRAAGNSSRRSASSRSVPTPDCSRYSPPQTPHLRGTAVA